MKKIYLLLAFAMTIALPAKAQLYAGGGFSYYTTQTSNTNQIVDYLSIAPEAGYFFSKVGSIGFAYKYARTDFQDGSLDNYTTQTFTPYFRPQLLEVGPLSLFVDIKFSYSRLAYLHYSETGYIIGVSPGISYYLTNRFFTVLNFGIAGYCSNSNAYGFEGWGADLGLMTTKLGFYYSFW